MALINQYRGVTFNGVGDAYTLKMTLSDHEGWAVEPLIRARTNQPGIREHMTVEPRGIPFIVLRNPNYTGTAKTPAQVRREMLAHFSPMHGVNQLIALHDDGSTVIFLEVEVLGVNFLGQTQDVAELRG